MKHLSNLPVPARMAHLKRDHRGYPVPFIVLIDDKGKPHFTVNEEHLRQRCIHEDLCAICGKRLLGWRWAVGGPLSMLHDSGVLIDTPLHRECLHYAMMACPYLAMPTYGKRIDAKTVKPEDLTQHRVLVNPGMMDNRPPLFVAAMFTDITVQGDPKTGYVRTYAPVRPYLDIEYWQDGTLLPPDVAEPIAAAYMKTQMETYLKGRAK